MNKTKLPHIKVTGNRGNWFAAASDDGRQIPVLWEHQYNYKEMKITTDWVANGRDVTKSKREALRSYYENPDVFPKEVILAKAADKNIRPHDRKDYIACFLVNVLSTHPEIELKVVSRVFHCVN